MFLLWATEQLWMMFLIKTEVNCTPKTSPPSFYETEAIFLTNYFHIKIWSDENLHNILAGHDLLKLLVSVNYSLKKIVISHVLHVFMSKVNSSFQFKIYQFFLIILFSLNPLNIISFHWKLTNIIPVLVLEFKQISNHV